MPEIIKRSSNVGVSGLIDRAYGRDPDKFVEGLQRIGIMEDLHIPIPGYRVPRIRYKRDNAAKWYGTTLSWMSIGYETQVPADLYFDLLQWRCQRRKARTTALCHRDSTQRRGDQRISRGGFARKDVQRPNPPRHSNLPRRRDR